jgi:hypothetical protein
MLQRPGGANTDSARARNEKNIVDSIVIMGALDSEENDVKNCVVINANGTRAEK